ncbi:hypothetical protein Runsl_3515 [Runella slithyformis DSM 19594]|uniref:DUF4271 domain-containing protein n=2 Tax=Runella TaxID=105 RepID=A0A7U3ZMF1_RUNSL|nr:hypothetical protein Runsl_3515 [Runella slithyformis DSM 19594]
MWCGAFPLWAEVGPDKHYFLVKDLTHQWLVYDRSEKEYVPYVAEQHNNQLSINTLVDLESNLHYDLLIYVEKNNYLFLNGSLQENLKAGNWKILKIDSLYRVFRRPQLMLTLYGTAGQAGKAVLIGHRKAAVEKLIVVEEESFLNLKPREQASIPNFFILGMLLLFTFAAFLFNTAPRAFYRLYSVPDLFQMDFRDDSYLINKPFGRTNILFVVLLSLELAYLYLFTQDKEYNLFSSKELLATGRTFSDTWLNYLKITCICFLAFIGKYFGLYILGTLYRLEGVANIHYFKVLQSSLLFFTTMLLSASVASFYIVDWSAFIRSLLIIPVVAFYLFRTFLIFFTISNSTTVKNLYLISYLCIVELIPIIIGVRYAL